METKQALVAIGGRATRLRADGVPVPISKSFLEVADRPLLYWCLLSLHAAGISDIVLAADQDMQLHEAELVLSQLPVSFRRLTFFRDEGFGVHGLPYYARECLDEQYIFECGHTVTPPRHYCRLDAAKRPTNAVFSAFRPHPQNLRYPIRLNRGRVEIGTKEKPGEFALAHPFVLDRNYGLTLPQSQFNIVNVINDYARRGQLRYVKAEISPEFDIEPEMELALRECEDYLRGVDGELGIDWPRKVRYPSSDARSNR